MLSSSVRTTIQSAVRSSTTHQTKLFATIAVLCLGSCILAGSLHAGPTADREDTIWLVSTRHLGRVRCRTETCPKLAIWKCEPGHRWIRSTIDDFSSLDASGAITTIYIHGNRVDSDQAVYRGLTNYRHLASGAATGSRLRHVIWSWPSNRIRGQLKDVRSKAQRTVSEGYYLGCFLSRLGPEDHVSLIGYSFGPRIATEAMHLLAGGTISGRSLPNPRVGQTPRIRVVALGGALDSDWLLPGRRHDRAVQTLDRMLVVYNTRDPYLRRYHWLAKDRRRVALGYSGLACPERLGEVASRIEQINVACKVGKHHDWECYVSSVTRDMLRVALWE